MAATHDAQPDRRSRRLLVTGGAGFIGTNFVQYWGRQYPGDRLVVLDALTYAGQRHNLSALASRGAMRFVRGNICDRPLVAEILQAEQIDTVVHFAAESHVDRSIAAPDEFIQTNVVGTFTLLEACRAYWDNSTVSSQPDPALFLHISTDEVFGSLAPEASPCPETHPYAPNSPYAATKAGSDHLVRAYQQTYGLPTIISRCTNNYGPYQFPEKLVPLTCIHILQGQPIPIYGDGQNSRDWLHVSDHCRALDRVIHRGQRGQTYNISSNQETSNLDLVQQLCALSEKQMPNRPSQPAQQLLTFVSDRPGHDRRYALDASKLKQQLNWQPQITLKAGLRQTFAWYQQQRDWWEPLLETLAGPSAPREPRSPQ